MNERIRELLVKAGVKLQARRPYVDEDPDGYLESDNDFFLNNREAIIMLLEEGGLKKFAELIVQECANIAGMNDDDTLSEGDIRARSIKRQIKEHFALDK